MPNVLTPVIPTSITVHLGVPDSPAQNVTVPFSEYIKNVASNEIYPTWPESSLRANIYAIISYALNRVYTEHYPAMGYDFDITNTTAFDQAYQKDGEVFENISLIVDDIFNDYVVRQGNIEPLFTQFCNGTTSICNGLSQWGSVTLANEGLTPYEILQRYYGRDINIVNNAPVADIYESYPGTPIEIGDAGNNVQIIQNQLNRIAQNYPAIPIIENANGVFGVDTEDAVKEFQRIFNLAVTGRVDKSTWYKIKQYYNGVKSLSELVSEGITIEEATVPFSTTLKKGDSGISVRTLQYYLNIIAYFNPDLNLSPLDGIFGEETENAVEEFQVFYGLPPTGIVENSTWQMLDRIYVETVASLPEGYLGNRAKLYPGYFLSKGMEGDEVRDLQSYLAYISDVFGNFPTPDINGVFDQKTEDSVKAFQGLFGLTPNGAVGPVTWNTIAQEYDNLITQNGNF